MRSTQCLAGSQAVRADTAPYKRPRAAQARPHQSPRLTETPGGVPGPQLQACADHAVACARGHRQFHQRCVGGPSSSTTTLTTLRTIGSHHLERRGYVLCWFMPQDQPSIKLNHLHISLCMQLHAKSLNASYLWRYHVSCLCILHQLCMTFMFYTDRMGRGARCTQQLSWIPLPFGLCHCLDSFQVLIGFK
ncbi:hypothetical protein COO60DRAFT_723533 [Scenedesmus sp. NREL 46B-D3]|nr:hypothetical protein COO60DRAFT_723533 [Scenedesmus sp. NREL 46B-D3]